MTRALKSQVQQQQAINLEAAMQILEQSTQPLVVDHNKLKVYKSAEGKKITKMIELWAVLSGKVNGNGLISKSEHHSDCYLLKYWLQKCNQYMYL